MYTLTELAEKALANAKRLDAYTASKGLPPTSLDYDSLEVADLPPELHEACNSLADLSQILKRLAQGPARTMTEILFSFTDIVPLQVIYAYNLPSHVPLTGTRTYAEIAQAATLPEPVCRRVLIHAMENGIFTEDSGEVKHSAFSRKLATEPNTMQIIGMVTSEFLPASTKLVEALERFPGSEEPNQTGFSIANDTSLPMYDFLEHHPDRMGRFGAAMGYSCRREGSDLVGSLERYSWKLIDHPGAVVVDIGGGTGNMSRRLAAATKNIRFIVQDRPGPVNLGRKTLPAELKGRVEYEAADFMTEQKVIGAKVYLFRWVLHNWNDTLCVKILRNLVPAMRKQSKVVVHEFRIAEQPELKWSRKQGRDRDLVLMTSFNGKARTVTDFKRLFKQADERFVFEGTSQRNESIFTTTSFSWNDGE